MKTLLLALLSLAVLPLHAGIVSGTFQGASGIGVKNATIGFQLNQAGLLSGTGAIVPTTVNCYTDANGAVVGLPNLLVTPIVAVNLGSGTLPGGIYYVEETWIASTGETVVSPELRIQLSGTGSLVFSPPLSVPANATGLHVYAATTSGAETLQGTASTTSTFTLGTPLVTGVTPPASNTTVCSIAFNDTIIPYSGYTVSLTSSTGNAYPGFPQSWQLNGGLNGTVNVSQGTPQFNGVTIYPQPIVAQPLNHGPQSISGPLDFGGYNVTSVGSITAGTANQTIHVNTSGTGDLPTKINAAFQTCGFQCTVYVDAGSYSASTTIVPSLQTFGTYALTFDPGTVLNYTGTGDAIQTPIASYAITGQNHLTISGGQITCSTNGTTNGIHTYPGNGITISGMLIKNCNNGILVEGSDVVQIDHNLINGNVVGVKLISTACSVTATAVPVCNPTNTGAVYSPNLINVNQNMIAFNSQWGIFDDGTLAPGSGSLKNNFIQNDLEQNGSAGSTYGSLQIYKAVGDTVSGNYFEGAPRYVVIGQNTGSPGDYFGCTGCVIRDNYFTTSPTTPYNIELQNAKDALLEGNTEQSSGLNTSATNCFILAATNGEVGTVIGPNAILQSAASNTGNFSCVGNIAGAGPLVGHGSYPLQNTNYYPVLAYQNFNSNPAVTSETIGVAGMTTGGSCFSWPKNAAANTAQYAGNVSFTAQLGSCLMTHPSGSTQVYDIYGIRNPNP